MSVEPQVRYFLDTNILVYAYDRTAGQKHAIAAQLVTDCWENENGCLSLQVLQEFFVNITRKITTPLDVQTARQLVADLAQWHMHIPEASDLLQAIDLHHTYQLSFWDALVLHSATRLECKQLISEDLSHGQSYATVQVINPFISND